MNNSNKYFFSISIVLFGLILTIFSCRKTEPLNKINTLSVDIANNSVTAHGEILELGINFLQQYGFCISLHSNLGINDEVLIIEQLPQKGAFSYTIYGLMPYTTYHIRAFANEGNHIIYGDVLSFSLNNLEALSVAAFNPLILSTSSISINGSITGLGSLALLDFGHCWSTTPAPTVNNHKTSFGASANDTAFTSVLENLNLETSYYVRPYAVLIGNHIVYGNEISLSIPDLIVQTNIHSFMANNEVALSGNILQLGVNPVLQHGFCWSYETPLPNINNNSINLGQIDTTGLFSATISHLDSVTYYFRAFATDGIHVKYGDVLQFIKY